jgi:tol-pal system protein YbgF
MPPPYVGRRIPGEEQAYQACLQTTLAGRPAEGIAMFEEFQQAFPDGRYAPNAEYWIGENLYAQGKYREALERFRNVWDHFPSHHKSADALLKAGMCLNKLGDKEGARHAYGMVLRYFPNSEAAGKLGHVK